ncbi:alpha/beta fold hydrolase [Conexibacter sp. DBS9H8]|uniref:alpha/beta fold hydrolase n=1 Tax=Conexibacter sp. DBS9H8 TaxID=2937801 RepID=UPI00200D7E7E|nr:alpha/beta hydrolase [Conexibacter sp. DBS9H8]
MTQVTLPSGIALEYETHGSPADQPILMVMGFGTQLIGWPRAFCAHLAAPGRYVISFDNRDTGLSQKFADAPAPIEAIMSRVLAGDLDGARALAPYTLSDMAADAVGLLDALGLERAHVLGASMGGFIAQTMAIEHPGRLLSLTSMMSSTGEPEYGQAAPASLDALLAPSPTEREAYIDSSSRWLAWHSHRYPEAEETRRLAAEAFDRGLCPEGTQRQLAAMLAGGSRAAALAALALPTLVLHGLDDTLIAPSGGERTAELIPGARLVLIADMGHDRPRPLWDAICQPIWEITACA